jgi:hypothetical protein
MMFLLAHAARVATNPSARSKERPARGRSTSFMHASIEACAMSRDRRYICAPKLQTVGWYADLASLDAKAPHR